MSLGWMTEFKNFLADRPEWAFLALSLVINGVLFRLLLKAYREQLTMTERIIPLADRLVSVIQAAASKARGRRLPAGD